MRPAAGSAVLGALLVFVGGLFDAEPLYVPGVGVLALALASATWVLVASRGVRIERTVGLERVVEDEPLPITLCVATRVPAPGGLLHDPLLDQPRPLQLGGHTTSVHMAVRFGRRGLRDLAPATVEITDPLGLASRGAGTCAPARVLVLPRVSPVPALTVAGGERPTPAGIGNAAAEVDFDGLRPYRAGAPASRIHWPAAARGAGLLERRLIADGDHRPLVMLDGRDAGADDLDAAVRAAASLAKALAAGGGCAVLLPGDRRATMLDDGLTGWPDLHARFALVAPRAVGLAAAHARRGAVVYVAGRRGARLPRTLAQYRGTVLLVVPGGLTGRRALFQVAGCSAYLEARGRAAA